MTATGLLVSLSTAMRDRLWSVTKLSAIASESGMDEGPWRRDNFYYRRGDRPLTLHSLRWLVIGSSRWKLWYMRPWTSAICPGLRMRYARSVTDISL